MNVFTAEDVTPLSHRVVSWGWRDPLMHVDEQRRLMLDETRQALRRFPDADEIARAYHVHKVLLDSDARLGVWKAIRWVFRTTRHADRVLVAALPGGVDRLLWVTAYLAARVMRKPIYVYSEVWVEPDGPRAWPGKLLRRSLRRAGHRFLVPGQVHRDHLLRTGVAPTRIEVVGSIYSPRPSAAQLLPVRGCDHGRALTLLYAGRFMPVKGLDRLVRISTRLWQAGAAFRLEVVEGRSQQYMGREAGYAERCRRLIEALPADRVVVNNHVDHMEDAYERADVLVMPNVIDLRDKVPAESWGRVVEEALLSGLPVVGTDAVPAVLESVVDGVNGYVVPWDRDEALEAALAAVIASASLD
jgi:glycosyltransferase involved in cell wall biosynthesis